MHLKAPLRLESNGGESEVDLGQGRPCQSLLPSSFSAPARGTDRSLHQPPLALFPRVTSAAVEAPRPHNRTPFGRPLRSINGGAVGNFRHSLGNFRPPGKTGRKTRATSSGGRRGGGRPAPRKDIVSYLGRAEGSVAVRVYKAPQRRGALSLGRRRSGLATSAPSWDLGT